MNSQAVATIGARDGVSQIMSKLFSVSKATEQVLPDGVYLHLLLTCQNASEIAGNGPFHLLPLQSSLFHEALAATNTRSASTSQALRDVFLVTYQTAEVIRTILKNEGGMCQFLGKIRRKNSAKGRSSSIAWPKG